MNIFDDAPREVLEAYLAETGQTEAEARAKHKEITERVEKNLEPMKGTDPTQEKKFTMPLQFDIEK